MSTQHKPRLDAPEPSEDGVAAYLEAHPDFFERHLGLLDTLRLPHRSGASTVSLVERQVDVLRERNRKLDRKLRELVGIARANEALVERIHRLSLRLLDADGLRERLAAVEAELRETFAVDQALLVLFAPPELEERLALGRFLRVVPADDEAMGPFTTLLASGQPRCGQIRDSQRDFLFGAGTDEIGSAALVPLGQPTAPLGLLALGSREIGHFTPASSTDLLRRIGELVGAAVARN